jgi:hypothetical protein
VNDSIDSYLPRSGVAVLLRKDDNGVVADGTDLELEILQMNQSGRSSYSISVIARMN